MIHLNKEHLNKLKDMIGGSISHISAQSMDEYTHISFLKLSAKIHLVGSKLNNVLFHCDYNKDFHDTEAGTMYYDYHLFYNHTLEKFEKEIHKINSSAIKKIEVFGRIIPKGDKKELMRFNKSLFKNVEVTDDLFIFHCENAQHYALVYDEFLHSIKFYKSMKDIQIYFLNANENYKLNHTIE